MDHVIFNISTNHFFILFTQNPQNRQKLIRYQVFNLLISLMTPIVTAFLWQFYIEFILTKYIVEILP